MKIEDFKNSLIQGAGISKDRQGAIVRLIEVIRRTGDHYLNMMRYTPLGGNEISALSRIYRSPEMGPAELARMMLVSRQVMTGLIDNLERDGYLTRAPHAQDRRRIVLSLTDKGEEIVRDFYTRIFDRLVCVTSSMELPVLTSLLESVDRFNCEFDRWMANNPSEDPFGKAR